MKDGCEYVSGIENTWEEFGRFILLNLTFYFLYYGYIRESVYWAKIAINSRKQKLKN